MMPPLKWIDGVLHYGVQTMINLGMGYEIKYKPVPSERTDQAFPNSNGDLEELS